MTLSFALTNVPGAKKFDYYFDADSAKALQTALSLRPISETALLRVATPNRLWIPLGLTPFGDAHMLRSNLLKLDTAQQFYTSALFAIETNQSEKSSYYQDTEHAEAYPIVKVVQFPRN